MTDRTNLSALKSTSSLTPARLSADPSNAAVLALAKSSNYIKDSALDLVDAYFSEGHIGVPKTSPVRHVCERILRMPLFDYTMGSVIMANLVLIVIDTDLGAQGQSTPPWVAAIYWVFLGTFVCEIALRMFVMRSHYWCGALNILDFVIVSVDVVLSILGSFDDELVGISAVRILRMFRLARAVKVLKAFPELRLMLAGLAGACHAILWGTVLLFLAILIWSVLAVQFIHPLNVEVAKTSAYDGCERCHRAYESTWQAALTFTTQIVAGDSWARETVPIIESYPLSAVFFILVFLTVGLAIMNLILGVVVNAATEARDNLAQELEDHKVLRSLEAQDQLMSMCREMDLDQSGELSLDEVQQGFETNPVFQDVLKQLDILDVNDLNIVWTILDPEKTGTLGFKRLVNQIYAMKSSRTQFMLAYIKFYITEIREQLRNDCLDVRKALDRDIEVMESRESAMVRELEVDIGKMGGTMNALEQTLSSFNYVSEHAVAQGIEPVAHPLALADKQRGTVAELELVRKQCLASIQHIRDSQVEVLEKTLQNISASISKTLLEAALEPESKAASISDGDCVVDLSSGRVGCCGTTDV